MPFLQNNPVRKQHGFTLIEVLVVAPLVILLIGVTVGYITSLTGEGLKTSQRNAMTFEVQNALDDIDQSAKSGQVLYTTGSPLGVNQGPNDGQSAFTSTATTLVLSVPATSYTIANYNLDGYDSRQLIRTGSSPCNTSNPLFTYQIVYFVNANRLFKRTIVPKAASCLPPSQVNSCSPTIMQGTPPSNCKAEDEKLLDNVSSFSISYRNSKNATLSGTYLPTSSSIVVNLSVQKHIAGSPISHSASIQSTLGKTVPTTSTVVLPAPPSAPIFTMNYPTTPYDSGGRIQWRVPSDVGSSDITGYRIRVVYRSSVCSDSPQTFYANPSPDAYQIVTYRVSPFVCIGVGSGVSQKTIADAYVSAGNLAGYGPELGGLTVSGFPSS
jgi:type II secretory pathway pseudopilin PulG